MEFTKFSVKSDGTVSASGKDQNGSFMVRGTISEDLAVSAMKIYADHCVFLWGQASFVRTHLASLSPAEKAMAIDEIDAFDGDWGFEEDGKEGTFHIEAQ